MLLGFLFMIVLACLAIGYSYLFKGRFFARQSLVIDLPFDIVSENLKDLSNWPQWIPWLLFEPNTKVHYDYSHAGETTLLPSCLSWKGKLIKEGYILMEPARSSASYCHAVIEANAFYPRDVFLSIDLTKQGSHTGINLQLTGSVPFLLRYKTALLKIRANKDLELSLLRLNAHLVQYSQRTDYEFADPSYTFLETKQLGHFDAVTRPFTAKDQSISQKIEQGFHDLFTALGPQNPTTGHRFTLYTKADPIHHDFEGVLGVLVQNVEPCDLHPERITLNGTYLQLLYHGSYQHLSLAWHVIHNMMRLQGHRPDKKHPSIEIYEMGPGQTNSPKEYMTKVCLPIK